MSDHSLSLPDVLSLPPVPTESLDDLAELVGELERQWQIALSQNCNPSQLKELCCLTPLLTGDGVPAQLAELVRGIDVTLRGHIDARRVPGAEDRQAVTAALVRLKAVLRGDEVLDPTLPQAPVRPSLVYIVTDDQAQGQYLALQVAAHGFETKILTDPQTLRETVLSAPPGALIADIAAGKTIIEAVGAVKQAVAGFLPVVFIASQGDARTRLAALRAGGDGYFTRPVPVPELVAKLRELTGDRQRPFRVLMVDDDRTILELYGGQLRGAGFQVHSLSDPWGVLEAAVEFQPELILLDLYMPEVDGFEISHLLRQEERFLNIPIVFLSGERDMHKQVKAFDAGAFDFLVKPVRPGQLIELVRARAAQYRRLADKVQYLGKTDPVTGLYNRHYFSTLLGERLEGQPAQGSIRALLFMELDRMPQAGVCATEVESLNLLRTRIARMINDHLIDGDLAAAYSEGVFTVLAEREDLAALEALAEALRRGVEAITVRFKGGTLDPCASIGLARAGDNSRRAISDAALACSLARLSGGNAIRLQDDLRDKVQDQGQRQYWMKQIGDAVKDQRLFLVYQPIASLVAENMERFEVLLRIRDEAGQTVLPGQFMEMARQLGLTRLLDRWVVSQALGNLALQQHTKPNTTFFIKLATETLLEGGFMEWLGKSIQQHKVRASSCVFEFPEADLRNQPAVNRSLIKRLQAMSIGLAIEHFSGSEPALEMLDSLPVNYVKLDRNLVHNLPDCPDRQKAVRAIIDKASTKGIRTIAAYVEDAASLSLLWQFKIDLIQGFFLQQPHEVARYDIAI